MKLKSFFRENKYFCWGLFFKKGGYRLGKIVDFFQKNFVLERAWFGSICYENTKIELSFEIEVVFSKKQILLLGSIFQKKEGYWLGKIVDFLQKNFVLERAWFGSICSENTIIELSFEIEVVFSRKHTFLLGSIFQKSKAKVLEKSSIFYKRILF